MELKKTINSRYYHGKSQGKFVFVDSTKGKGTIIGNAFWM